MWHCQQLLHQIVLLIPQVSRASVLYWSIASANNNLNFCCAHIHTPGSFNAKTQTIRVPALLFSDSSIPMKPLDSNQLSKNQIIDESHHAPFFLADETITINNGRILQTQASGALDKCGRTSQCATPASTTISSCKQGAAGCSFFRRGHGRLPPAAAAAAPGAVASPRAAVFGRTCGRQLVV